MLSIWYLMAILFRLLMCGSMRVLLISAITDSNVFSWLIYSRNFLFIGRVYCSNSGMPEKLSCIYCSPAWLVPPNVIYESLSIWMLGESFGNRGITSSFQCEVATDKSKGINLRNFIVGCCSFVQEYRDRRYPVVGHASLWIVTYTKRGERKV